jgi:hypothetical protein
MIEERGIDHHREEEGKMHDEDDDDHDIRYRDQDEDDY